jgi:excisionase family DNA binding protein
MTKDEETYTPAEVAEIMRVSRQTVYNLLQGGELRAIKLGNQWRIPASALDELQNRPPRPATKDNGA